MPVTISIRFLAGRAHLHAWDTHHSEGQVEWPPSPWRLLRAFVAVAGRGLTSLPAWDHTAAARQEPIVTVPGLTRLSKRGVPDAAKAKLSLRRGQMRLTGVLSDEQRDA